MSRTQEFLDKMREKPEHVRKQVAVGASGVVTGLVALVWFGTLAATGAFTLAPAGEVAQEPQAAPVAFTNTNVRSNFQELLGAVGAATGATPSEEPGVTVIDGNTSSTFREDTPVQTSPSATVIPF